VDTTGLEIVIQLCRLQIQREMDMTAKLRGVRASLDKLRHAVDHDADKLAARIESADAKRASVFEASHGAVAGVERDLREVEELLSDLEKSNGPPSSGGSEEPSNVAHLRSSEVAQR
jgi:hypothetical protein